MNDAIQLGVYIKRIVIEVPNMQEVFVGYRHR